VIRLALGFAAFIALLIVLADTRNLGPLYVFYDFPYGDKVGHVVLYGTLMLLSSLALMQFRGGASSRSVLMVGGAMVVLVSLEELSQLMFPARTVDLLDLAASYTGIAWFGCLSLFVAEWRRASTRPVRIAE
jgi:VanZ family protein